MVTSIRFDKAIKKLYLAFHKNTLNPEDCKQCAVGNILDNQEAWKHLTDKHGSVKLNYLGMLHQNLGKRFNGYAPIELLKIENAFLRGCGYEIKTNSRLYQPDVIDAHTLFKGLCEVVSQLCELDNIDNVIDCSVLFAFNDKSKAVLEIA